MLTTYPLTVDNNVEMWSCSEGGQAPPRVRNVELRPNLTLNRCVRAQIKPDFSDFDAIFGVSEQLCKILSHARLGVLHMCTLASDIVALWARSPLAVDNNVDHFHVHELLLQLELSNVNFDSQR